MSTDPTGFETKYRDSSAAFHGYRIAMNINIYKQNNITIFSSLLEFINYVEFYVRIFLILMK